MSGSSTIKINFTSMELATLSRLQGYMPEILKLVENGVFDVSNGQVTLHKDTNGKIRRIDIHVTKYNK